MGVEAYCFKIITTHNVPLIIFCHTNMHSVWYILYVIVLWGWKEQTLTSLEVIQNLFYASFGTTRDPNAGRH